MAEVESEAIREIEYDADAEALFVRFTDGDWYRYAGVPPELHAAFLAADSHGRFFQAHIRDRFDYAKRR
jgi:hypothetical protein